MGFGIWDLGLSRLSQSDVSPGAESCWYPGWARPCRGCCALLLGIPTGQGELWHCLLPLFIQV